MRIYSKIGGYMDVPGHEVESFVAKGWFAEGSPGWVEPSKTPTPLVDKPETGTMDGTTLRVGRPRRGSVTETG